MKRDVYESVVITGGGGMLAHALADELRARGVEPRVLTRPQCDVASEADVAAVFERRPTLVLNCAAHTKVDQCELEPERADAINGHGVGRLARLSRECGARLVHVSTDFVFDGTGAAGRPYRVEDAVGPLSAYGRSKLLGEKLVQEVGPAGWMIVRTAWVYGRHGANFPRTMVTVARAGKPLNVVCDQVGAPTYTVDLAEGILALVDAGASGIFHVTNSGQTNWCDFAKAALAEFGIEHPVGSITSAEWGKVKPNAAHRPSYSVLDLSRYEQATGRGMRDWREALGAFAREVGEKGF